MIASLLPGWTLRPLRASGFCDTWCATRGGRRLFVKSACGERAAMLQAEADGLRALGAARAIRVPQVDALENRDGATLLALEWLDFVPPGAGFGERFGRALGQLHAHPQGSRFGWPRDNFIGATPQWNAQDADWLGFWAEQRLHAMAGRLEEPLRQEVEAVVAVLPRLFDDGHAPRPSLIHGDLWSGNWGTLADGTPVVYDPAVSCSDAEAELAMMELFGAPPPGFWPAYRAAAGLHEGYPRRRPLYQLYHLLNHAVLFGGGYAQQALRCARGISAR